MTKTRIAVSLIALLSAFPGAARARGAGEDGPPPHSPATPEDFRRRVISVGLENPWEVAWGPDGYLWVTERTGKRVTRVHPADGSRRTALEVPEANPIGGQEGLLGMALDPGLLTGTGHDFVYLAFTYDAAAGTADPVDRRVELRRYEYDAATQTLVNPATLLAGLPASSDHNSGRLAYGPDAKLYYTIGDQGANQFDNKCLLNRAQDLPSAAQIDAHGWSVYTGKILRIGLDGSIPVDNPVLAGVRSHVFSYGHRNAQGIVFGPGGTLYSSEQGPKSDDEINIIRPGQNYGWPYVAGFKDDQAYVYANWSLAPDCRRLAFDDYVLPPSVPWSTESAWTGSFVPPIVTFYTVPGDYNFHDPACRSNEFICWPTIATSSLDLYTQHRDGIPGWENSLLAVSLKRGAVFRSRLSRDGLGVEGEPEEVFRTVNRYRDLAQAPNGRAIYVVTDSTGQTSGPSQGFTGVLADPGALMEFAYAPAPPAPAPSPPPAVCDDVKVQQDDGRFRFEFAHTSLEIDATFGGRITRFARDGGGHEPLKLNILTGPALVADGDTVAQSLFGSTVWTSPQSVWSWPPEAEIDSAPYAATLTEHVLHLLGGAGPITGIAIEKSFTPDSEADQLHIEYMLHNTGAAPTHAAPWEVSRVPKAGLVLFPAEFVALPQSTLASQLIDGIAWVDLGAPPAGSAKLFQDGREGWLAYVNDGVAFIKRFEDIEHGEQAPGEADIGVYVDGTFDYVELEQQGRYAEIPPGGSSEAWPVQWRLRRLPEALRGEAHVGSRRLVEWVRAEARR